MGDTETAFTYRLPLTWVRVVGSRTVVTDALAPDEPAVECVAVVTTEVGADPLTAVRVVLSPPGSGSQKVSWTLTGDGRLSGADVATTLEPLADAKAGLEAAGFVLGLGAPLLAGAGPAGWLALAGTAAAAGVGTTLLAGGSSFFLTGAGTELRRDDQHTALDDAPPEDWDVHPQYLAEHDSDARSLANYRAALAEGTRAHAAAVREVVAGVDHSAPDRLRELERALRSATVAGGLAEARYADWLASKKVRTVTRLDERVRIDDLPTEQELTAWRRDGAPGPVWAPWSSALRTAVTVDLERTPGDQGKLPRLEFVPQARRDVVDHRPPRPAVLQVWTLTPRSGGGYDAERTEIHRMLVAYPGNEATLSTRSDAASKSVVAAFDTNGALVSLASDDIDPSLQRARDLSALFPAVTAAAESGQKLRAAVSPPTLAERAAELEAAQKLGLVAAAPDPHQALKDQLEEQRLRAQFALTRQLADAAPSSPTFVVHVDGPLG